MIKIKKTLDWTTQDPINWSPLLFVIGKGNGAGWSFLAHYELENGAIVYKYQHSTKGNIVNADTNGKAYIYNDGGFAEIALSSLISGLEDSDLIPKLVPYEDTVFVGGDGQLRQMIGPSRPTFDDQGYGVFSADSPERKSLGEVIEKDLSGIRRDDVRIKYLEVLMNDIARELFNPSGVIKLMNGKCEEVATIELSDIDDKGENDSAEE